MTELLSGMRVIKFFGWEQALGARVEACRAQELGRLWVIKYLDAVCVYLWAALPVVISIIIFITYVLMGHQLTATKVRTRRGVAVGKQGREAARRQRWSEEVGSTLAGKEGGGSLTTFTFPNQGKILQRDLFLGPWICDPSVFKAIPFFPLFLFFQLLVRPKLCVRSP